MTQDERKQLNAVIEDLEQLWEYMPGQAMYSQRTLKQRIRIVLDELQEMVGIADNGQPEPDPTD